MKKILVLGLVLVLVLSVAGCTANNGDKQPSASGGNSADGDWFVEGLYLKCDNGADIIITDPVGDNAASPCAMTPKDDTVSFDNLTDGDRIKINIVAIEETYPGKTEVHSIEKLADGQKADIPLDVMESLKELGWVE